MRALRWLVFATVSLLLALVAAAASSGPLFPVPFRVEHQLIQSGPEGVQFTTEPVTDTYGGSWLVSSRADQGRQIVDFARREITDVRLRQGTYSVLSFSRMAELRRRLHEAERHTAGLSSDSESAGKTVSRKGRPAVTVDEVSLRDSWPASPIVSPVLSRPGIHHYRARSERSVLDAPLEVWTDGAVRFSEEARAALYAFEDEVLGESVRNEDVASLARLMAEARDKSEGAFPVRTRRPLGPAGMHRFSDDVAVKVELLSSFSSDLVSIPEGLKRVPHPLELVTARAEEEATRAASPRAKGK